MDIQCSLKNHLNLLEDIKVEIYSYQSEAN